MSKRPLNLTIHQHILDTANEIMGKRGYTSMSTFVEDLVRNEYANLFGKPLLLKDAASPAKQGSPQPVSYKKIKNPLMTKRIKGAGRLSIDHNFKDKLLK